MPTPPRHLKEELDALLDGQLDESARAEVEAHLAACDECRRALDALRWTKQFAATRFAAPDAPADLQAKIQRSLHAETIAESHPPRHAAHGITDTPSRSLPASASSPSSPVSSSFGNPRCRNSSR